MGENRLMDEFRKLKKFKVLIGTPHYEGKNYCLENYVRMVKSLNYPNYEVLVVDNSKDRKNTKLIKKMGIPAIHVKRKNKNSRQVMAESQEVLRNAALKGGFDFFIHLESDITPPPNFIERLLSHQHEIVSGAYFIREGAESHLMVQSIESQRTGIRETINMDGGTDNKYFDGQLHEVYACGLGCTLIHRSVLERIEFSYVEGLDLHADSLFAHDIHQLGYKQYLDTSILCEHDNQSWELVGDK